MLHLRVVTPSHRSDELIAALTSLPEVVNLVVIAGAARKPAGDLVTMEVPSESANRVIAMLQERGVDADGSITIDRSPTVLSAAAQHAALSAPGAGSEAVVWAEVDSRSEVESELTLSYVVMFVVATLIAAVGILSDSVVLLIGAMVISPEYPPMMGVSLGIHARRWRRVASAMRTVCIGFGVGIVAAVAFAGGVRALGATPHLYEVGARPLTQFISHPDGWTVVVALLAGVAGTISLTQARPSSLVGVFISVTTMPAAANVAVAAVHERGEEALGALAQLVLNVAIIVLAGSLTLAVEHALGSRRFARASQRTDVSDWPTRRRAASGRGPRRAEGRGTR